jgi:sterol desaturase/sphingolipid hydroxylase (fatty acid hydroxylase superfamily)
MDIVNIPIAMLQINGHSFLYDSTSNGLVLWYELLQYPLAILFMDTGIYWLHWAFHRPFLYSHAHKTHHRYETRVVRFELHRVINSSGSLFPLHLRPLHFIPWKLAS